MGVHTNRRLDDVAFEFVYFSRSTIVLENKNEIQNEAPGGGDVVEDNNLVNSVFFLYDFKFDILKSRYRSKSFKNGVLFLSVLRPLKPCPPYRVVCTHWARIKNAFFFFFTSSSTRERQMSRIHDTFSLKSAVAGRMERGGRACPALQKRFQNRVWG